MVPLLTKWHNTCLGSGNETNSEKMATGKINVSADNIFPIIKKFLYSDQEIFLRELISLVRIKHNIKLMRLTN